MKKPATMFQHFRATNDANGNPRRVFVFYTADGSIAGVIDEGYRGRPKECAGLVELPAVSCSASERRDLLREFPEPFTVAQPRTEAQEIERGELLARVLNVQPAEQKNRYATNWGTKTALGLYRTARRIVEDGE